MCSPNRFSSRKSDEHPGADQADEVVEREHHDDEDRDAGGGLARPAPEGLGEARAAAGGLAQVAGDDDLDAGAAGLQDDHLGRLHQAPGRLGGDRPDARERLGAVGPGGPRLQARFAGEEHQPERPRAAPVLRQQRADAREPLLDLAAVGDERGAGARGEQRALERGQALALGCDGRDDLDPQQARELAGVDVDAGLLGLVAHVQAEHERASALEQLGGQAQRAAQVLGVGDLDDDVRLALEQDVAGDALVVGVRVQAVDAGGVDDREGLLADAQAARS